MIPSRQEKTVSIKIIKTLDGDNVAHKKKVGLTNIENSMRIGGNYRLMYSVELHRISYTKCKKLYNVFETEHKK